MRIVTGDPTHQCLGKAAHRNHRAATIQARKSGDPSIMAYRCPHCAKWHVGHAIGWIAKRLLNGSRR